jgi:hypothetical protein
MHRAGGRFGKHGRVRLKPFHREDLPMIGACVLGEEAGPMDAHALGVGAPYELAGQAIVAVAAEDVRVDRHPLPRAEAGDFGPDLIDFTDRLVPRGKGIDADLGTIVQV